MDETLSNWRRTHQHALQLPTPTPIQRNEQNSIYAIILFFALCFFPQFQVEMLYQRYFLRMNQSNTTHILSLLLVLILSLAAVHIIFIPIDDPQITASGNHSANHLHRNNFTEEDYIRNNDSTLFDADFNRNNKKHRNDIPADGQARSDRNALDGITSNHNGTQSNDEIPMENNNPSDLIANRQLKGHYGNANKRKKRYAIPANGNNEAVPMPDDDNNRIFFRK